MTETELMKFLKERLSLNVSSGSEYTGTDGSCSKYTSIKLMFDDEIISEMYL